MLDDQCRSLDIKEKDHLAGKITTTDQDSSPPPLSGSSHHSTTRFSPLVIELKVIFQHLYFSSYSLLSFYLLFHLTSFHKLLAVWGGLSSASAHNLVPRLHNFFWNIKKEATYVNQGAHIDNVEFKGWMLKPIRGWAVSRLTYVLIKLSTFS